MAGIYQINQQTGSVTLPTPGNTFIGTSNNSELYTVDSSGNVTIYGTGGGSTTDTGSFATTGSNIFVGDQTITGSINSISQTPSGSQGIVQINDGDLLSIFPILSGSGMITSGSFMGVRYVDPNNICFNAGVSNIGNVIKSTGFSISSGSALINISGQTSAGGTQTQMIFSPDFVNGSELYTIQVGSTSIGEIILILTKGDSSGEGIQLRASNLTEGFMIENNFSDISSSLFKVESSGSIPLFDARNNGVVLPIVSQSLDYVDDAAAGTAGVPLGGVYRSGSILKIRIS